MLKSAPKSVATRLACATAIATIFLSQARCWAVSPTELDTFQDGSAEGWGIFDPVTPAFLADDEGPTGAGDTALLMDSTLLGSGKLLVRNESQWLGNWTSAGISQIKFDVRNPNAFPLSMRLGIAGPGGVSGGGNGDTHVTTGMTVAADNNWHSLTVDVLATNFTALNGDSTTAALAAVSEFRIIHNPMVAYVGQNIGGQFYLDNIRAIVPTLLPGDYNHNNVVDTADYVIWRETLTLNGPNLAADGTGPGGTPDGVVNDLDYDFWKARFGNSAPGTGAALAAAMIPEPESASLMLLIFSGAYLWICGRSISFRQRAIRPIVLPSYGQRATPRSSIKN